MCCVVYLFTNVHIIHRFEVNARVTGFAVKSLRVVANVVQVGFAVYQLYNDNQLWEKQIQVLKDMKANLLDYQRKMLVVSS